MDLSSLADFIDNIDGQVASYVTAFNPSNPVILPSNPAYGTLPMSAGPGYAPAILAPGATVAGNNSTILILGAVALIAVLVLAK